MGFFSDLIDCVVSVATTVINVAVRAADEIFEAAAKAVDHFFGADDVSIIEAKNVQARAKDELREINNELLYLNSKNYPSQDDRRRMDYLSQRRDKLKTEIYGVDEIVVADEINKESDAFAQFVVDDDRAHIYQGMVGPSSFGKKCPTCGREMQLQWARNVVTASVDDFFWGCTGWYYSACNATVRVVPEEMNIFARIDAPEYEISNQEFTSMIMLPRPSRIVNERMSEIIVDQRAHKIGSEGYRCPVHGEDLVLREKKANGGLLDQYFLGCPRWQPGSQGCNHIVKLKSAAQLSTYLHKQTGSGIL